MQTTPNTRRLRNGWGTRRLSRAPSPLDRGKTRRRIRPGPLSDAPGGGCPVHKTPSMCSTCTNATSRSSQGTAVYCSFQSAWKHCNPYRRTPSSVECFGGAVGRLAFRRRRCIHSRCPKHPSCSQQRTVSCCMPGLRRVYHTPHRHTRRPAARCVAECLCRGRTMCYTHSNHPKQTVCSRQGTFGCCSVSSQPQHHTACHQMRVR